MSERSEFSEAAISAAILDSYHQKLSAQIVSDVVVVGAGPSGLVAAFHLAAAGKRVTILEKRLTPGGGIWGGAIGMNEVLVQEEAVSLVTGAGVRVVNRGSGLYTMDAAELACALCLKAIQAGAVLINLMMLEDLCVRGGKITGVVANRTTIGGVLPVDPIVLSAGTVIDATGHEAVAVQQLRKRGLLTSAEVPGEGPMDAPAGESFVVEQVGEPFPGLWVTGMSVCTTYGGPRMGPIFGGMLLSGRRVANRILGIEAS